jgi:F0F1-type ATP synthase membrane subunit b/b'
MAIAEYVASLVGFLLIIYFGWRKVAPPVRKLMTQRQDAIRQQVEDAKLAAERLAAAEKKYQDGNCACASVRWPSIWPANW